MKTQLNQINKYVFKKKKNDMEPVVFLGDPTGTFVP